MRLDFRFTAIIFLLIVLFSIPLAAILTTATTSDGVIFWKTWGGKGDDIGNSVALDSSGNIYVTGSTNSFGNQSQLFLLKFDAVGSLLWQKAWNGSHGGQSISVDSAGNIYLAGVNKGAFLLKTNADGEILWQERLGNSSIINESLALDASGYIYITGTFSYNYTSSNPFLMKLGPNGLPLWQKTWIGNYTSAGLGVAISKTGEIYMSGEIGGYCAGRSSYAGLVLKVDSNGNLVWQRSWGRDFLCGIPGTYTSSGITGITTDSMGNIYVAAGTVCLDFGGSDATFAKFNSSGAPLWERGWSLQPDNDICPSDAIPSLVADSSGNIYATGTDFYGVLFVNLDTNGNLLSAYSWGSKELSYLSNEGRGIVLDNSGIPVLAGFVNKPPYVYWTQIKGPEPCSCKPPVSVPFSGMLRNITLATTPINGSIVDVSASLTYAGGRDVFIDYGSRLPVSSFSPFEEFLLVTASIIAVKIVFFKPLRAKTMKLA